MPQQVLSKLPEIDPLADFDLTFDHFYQFIKRAAQPEAHQLIQIRAAAEPLELSMRWKWHSYYQYLLKVDTKILPTPITEKPTQETVGLTDGQLAYEYGRLLAQLVRFVELKELPAEVNARISSLEQSAENSRAKVTRLLEQDTPAWASYARVMGLNAADTEAFTQWWYAYGHAEEIDNLREDIANALGEIDLLRLDRFADADQEEIFRAFSQFNNVGSRLRWPRLPDSMYREEGGQFSVDYLARLPPGDTALFADRRYVFPVGVALESMLASQVGSFSESLTRNSQATESVTRDWNMNVSGRYGWFKVSAAASEHTAIKEDFRNTQSIAVSCKSCLKIPFDARPWFVPEIFQNAYVKKNIKSLDRYFGTNGTLRFYPAALLLARGMKLEFQSSANYQYDYERKFSVSGSASARVFGIRLGGGGGYSEHVQKQTIQAQGHTLTLDDGETNFRVLGYVVNRVNIDVVDEHLAEPGKRFMAAANLRGR